MSEVNGNGSFSKAIEALMNGMDGHVSSKCVVGDPVVLGETTIIPLVNVSFGMGVGSFAGEKKKNQAGGLGAKVTPVAVLVVKGSSVRMMSVTSTDWVSKILDMIPDYVDKIADAIREKTDPEKAAIYREARKQAAEELKDKLNIEE